MKAGAGDGLGFFLLKANCRRNAWSCWPAESRHVGSVRREVSRLRTNMQTTLGDCPQTCNNKNILDCLDPGFELTKG